MSLRARLLIGTVVIAVVLAVTAVAVIRTTRSNLVAQVDAQLALASTQLGGRPNAPGGRPADGPRLSNLYVGFLTEEGSLLTRSAPDLAGDEAATPVLGPTAAAAVHRGDTITVSSDDPDVDYRVTGRAAVAGGGTAVVALPLDGVDEAIRRLLAVEALAVLAVAAVLGLVTWWVIHLGVRPVRRMTATAGAIAGGDLSARVPEERAGTEAGDLGVALNGMLGRIEDAFDQRASSEARLRQFVADASHELRTPVATIRPAARGCEPGNASLC
jgi:two-component system OmpR family sensor kinase